MYALSRRFGTTVENLERLNGISAPRPPFGKYAESPGGAKSATEPAPEEQFGQPQPTESDTLTTGRTPGERGGFSGIGQRRAASCGAVAADDRWRQTELNYLDFYQGFLLGLEKIKTQYGYSVRVDLFNTRQESDRLRTIVDDADFRAARLIVGPGLRRGASCRNRLCRGVCRAGRVASGRCQERR